MRDLTFLHKVKFWFPTLLRKLKYFPDPVQGKGKGKAAAPQWNVAPPEHAADLSKSSLDSKAQALSTLTTLTHYPDGLAPYIGKFFEVALSSLQFRESKIVRKSAAM